MGMAKLKIGIMPQEKIRERYLAIAQGKYQPKRDDPKVWFTSMKSLAEVLSDENRALLQTILEFHPDSIKELSEITGRKSSSLSRTLRTMASYGIVELESADHSRSKRPIVKANDFVIQANLQSI